MTTTWQAAHAELRARIADTPGFPALVRAVAAAEVRGSGYGVRRRADRLALMLAEQTRIDPRLEPHGLAYVMAREHVYARTLPHHPRSA